MTEARAMRTADATVERRRAAALFVGMWVLLAAAPDATFAQTIGRVFPPATPGQPGEIPVKVSSAANDANGQTLLGNGSAVTAASQTLGIGLSRGGDLHLCATSSLHLSASGGSPATSRPLLLALDRGAVEIDMPAVAQDTIMTPDLSFRVMDAKPSTMLQLQVRVARNGDTCVQNSGATAPELAVAEQFGDATYRLQPGQHVLFEHGSLKEVVDHETSPCGCPPAAPVSVADAGTTSSNPAKAGAEVATEAAAHPFPVGVSEGLDAPPVPAASKPGEVQTQITMPMTYNGDAPAAAAKSASSGAAPASGEASDTHPQMAAPTPTLEQPAAAPASARPAPSEPPPSDLVHVIGRFFKRIFHRS